MDRGWLTPDVPARHRDFGGLLRCSCQPDMTAERLARFTALPVALRGKTFAALEWHPEDMDGPQGLLWKTVMQDAMAYAKGETVRPWFVMAGTVGWGKTHLAVAILNYRIDHPEAGPPGKYINCPDFLAGLRDSIGDDSLEATLGLYRDVPLLVLDELGGEYRKRRGDEITWADEMVYRLVDHRYLRAMPTVVTTNADAERDVNARVVDRLNDRGLSTVHSLELPSYRTGEVI